MLPLGTAEYAEPAEPAKDATSYFDPLSTRPNGKAPPNGPKVLLRFGRRLWYNVFDMIMMASGASDSVPAVRRAIQSIMQLERMSECPCKQGGNLYR